MVPLLVSSRQQAQHAKMRHCLCPQDLAAALGKSVHTLCANGNINALEALMPEPFGLLHRAFLAAPAAPMVRFQKSQIARSCLLWHACQYPGKLFMQVQPSAGAEFDVTCDFNMK
jgi:hypothetical protein